MTKKANKKNAARTTPAALLSVSERVYLSSTRFALARQGKSTTHNERPRSPSFGSPLRTVSRLPTFRGLISLNIEPFQNAPQALPASVYKARYASSLFPAPSVFRTRLKLLRLFLACLPLCCCPRRLRGLSSSRILSNIFQYRRPSFPKQCL